jgi:hypothetical protein
MNFDFDWYFDGEEVIGANSQTLTPFSNGTYGISITDTYGCTILREIEVMYLSVLEEEATIFSIYPNPAKDYVTISSKLLLEKGSKIYIYNLLGSLVQQINVDNSNNSTINIDVSDLSKGTYVVSINTKTHSRLVIH